MTRKGYRYVPRFFDSYDKKQELDNIFDHTLYLVRMNYQFI